MGDPGLKDRQMVEAPLAGMAHLPYHEAASSGAQAPACGSLAGQHYFCAGRIAQEMGWEKQASCRGPCLGTQLTTPLPLFMPG